MKIVTASHGVVRGGALLALAAAASLLVGCTAVSTPKNSTAAAPSGAITVWSWSPHAQDMVDLFQKSHPTISVKLVSQGDGPTTIKKLETAFAAGSGAPDVAMAGYSSIPGYVLSKYIQPLDDLGGEVIKSDFMPATVAQVTVNGKVYGAPLDASPMAFVYRDDLFTTAGVQPPKTWAEFEGAAAKFHAALPASYIANSPLSDGTLQQMLWQAGVKPIALNNAKVTIKFNTTDAQKVADYWQRLSKSQTVGSYPAFSPEWNAALADGSLAGWIAPSWAPIILKSVAAGTTGHWKVAPIPTWDKTPSTAEFGGSAYTVTKQSKNPSAAALFAIWVNHDPKAYKLNHELVGGFPTLKSFATDQTFLGTPDPFFGGQPIGQVFSAASQSVVVGWQWSPFNSTVDTAVNDASSKLQTGQAGAKTELDQVDQQLTTYAKKQGFTVK